MKNILLALLLLAGCPSTTESIKDEEYIKCAWNEKYQVCFCGANLTYQNAVLTWAPDEVCGK